MNPLLRRLERQLKLDAARSAPTGDGADALASAIRQLIREELAAAGQQAPRRAPSSPRLRALHRSMKHRAELAETHLPPYVPAEDRQPYPSMPMPSDAAPSPARPPKGEVKVAARDPFGRVARLDCDAFGVQLVRDENGRIAAASVTPAGNAAPFRCLVRRDRAGKMLSISIGETS